ncbi:hypothetical protein GCM10010278_78410 [Streptomyces melanogenes]|nr:hypothetical protein GCM10010278_78410 [Streptomyces melanogenes]
MHGRGGAAVTTVVDVLHDEAAQLGRGLVGPCGPECAKHHDGQAAKVVIGGLREEAPGGNGSPLWAPVGQRPQSP